MRDLGAGDGVYLGNGDWLSWDDFGEFDPDEPQGATLPVLEWQAEMTLRFPRAEVPVIRQFVRLTRAAQEFHEETGRHLDLSGAIGELYGAMAWGIRLHRKLNAQGSDGRLGNDHVEIKTIGPRNKTKRVSVPLTNRNFNKLLVVCIDAMPPDDLSDYGREHWSEYREVGDTEDAMPCWPLSWWITSRMVDKSKLTKKTKGRAGIAWSRACELGEPPPRC